MWTGQQDQNLCLHNINWFIKFLISFYTLFHIRYFSKNLDIPCFFELADFTVFCKSKTTFAMSNFSVSSSRALFSLSVFSIISTLRIVTSYTIIAGFCYFSAVRNFDFILHEQLQQIIFVLHSVSEVIYFSFLM